MHSHAILGVCIDLPCLPQRIYAGLLPKAAWPGWFDLVWTRPAPISRSLAEETAIALGTFYHDNAVVSLRSSPQGAL